MDKNIAAAAIERLEAERQRRIGEKIAKGEIVGVPLGSPEGVGCVIVSGSEDADEQLELAKADKIAELRKAGETREIIFVEPTDGTPTVIITGVPRGELDDDEAPPIAKSPEDKAPRVEDFGARRRVNEMLSSVDRPMPTTPPPASIERLEEGPHQIHVQIRGSDPDKGDCRRLVHDRWRRHRARRGRGRAAARYLCAPAAGRSRGGGKTDLTREGRPQCVLGAALASSSWSVMNTARAREIP
jgi:hypothetical protein